MNDKRLRIYLDDHHALMVAEIELIARCRGSNRKSPLGEFLQQLENDVQAQKSIIKDACHRLGMRESITGLLKQGTAWFAEKLGRVKLNDSLIRYSELSRVVELETLAVAAQERIALWDNFDSIAENDARLEGITFSHFRDLSKTHLDELNARRRFAAVEAFVGNG